MKKHYLAWLLLTQVFTAASLCGQTLVSRPAKKPFYAWGGLQMGIFGSGGYGESGLLVLGYSVTAQFGRNIFGSIYHLGGSAFLGDNDAIDESGCTVGLCSRTKKVFAGAAIGLGWTSGWLGPSTMNREIGLPLKLEGALIIGRFVALGLQLHAFLWKHPYSGMSLSVQLGKMR